MKCKFFPLLITIKALSTFETLKFIVIRLAFFNKEASKGERLRWVPEPTISGLPRKEVIVWQSQLEMRPIDF
jgi:hypothetical protein